MLTKEEFQKIYEEGPEACYKLFLQFSEQIGLLTKRVHQLEAQQAKNSKNSSKPPSSDQKKQEA